MREFKMGVFNDPRAPIIHIGEEHLCLCLCLFATRMQKIDRSD
jgi:hypothetical protein